jgi:hypothetical protein
LTAPVATSYMHNDAFPDNHPKSTSICEISARTHPIEVGVIGDARAATREIFKRLEGKLPEAERQTTAFRGGGVERKWDIILRLGVWPNRQNVRVLSLRRRTTGYHHGAHPASCAVAQKSIEIIEKETWDAYLNSAIQS